MAALRRVLETLHTVALGVWLGALVMGGVVAAVVFPLMRGTLHPTLPGFAGYEGSHADLAAGMIAARVFLVVDVIQFACAIIVGGTLLAMVATRTFRVSRVGGAVRVAAVVLLFVVIGSQFFLLGPRMNHHLRAYWDAAAAGDTPTAEQHREAFAKDHPTATRLMGLSVLLVGSALVAGVWSIAGDGAQDQPGRQTPTQPRHDAELEEPRLVRGRR